MSNDRGIAASYAVEVVRDICGLESIRPVWEQMQKDSEYPIVNGDIDRYISVIRGLDGQASPYVLIIQTEGRPRVILVGRKEKHRLKLKFGYKGLFEVMLPALVVEYGGVLGEMTEELCVFILRDLKKKLKEKEFEAVLFNHLRTDSLLHKLSRSEPSVWCRTHFPKKELHRVMVVPENIDNFYAAHSATHRSHLKRLLRKIDSTFPGKVRMVTYTGSEELEKGIAAAERVSRLTYQHELGAGFEDNELVRGLMAIAADRGWLRLSVLYVVDQPCCYQIGFVYNKAYFLNYLGFDPEFRHYSVGIVLFLKYLEQLCADSSVGLIDFGFGDAEYKRRFGSDCWEEANIYIFAPCFRSVFINVVQTIVMMVSIAAEKVLKRTGLLRMVKRWWRDELREGAKRR
jgi:hypothetical protein